MKNKVVFRIMIHKTDSDKLSRNETLEAFKTALTESKESGIKLVAFRIEGELECGCIAGCQGTIPITAESKIDEISSEVFRGVDEAIAHERKQHEVAQKLEDLFEADSTRLLDEFLIGIGMGAFFRNKKKKQ